MQGYSKRAKKHKREREMRYNIYIIIKGVTRVQGFGSERTARGLVRLAWALAKF
jgi:hypothetical protein